MATTPPPVVETPSAVPPRPGSPKYHLLESRIDIANVAHASLSQQVTELERRWSDSLARDYSGDIRLLRADVNSILECLGTPAAFVEGYREFVEEVKTHMMRVTGRMDTLEALLREDLNAPRQEEVKVISTQHRSSHLPRHPGKRVHRYEVSSSSDSETSSSSSSSRSSREGRGRRRGEEPSSRATYTSHGAIRAREKGRRHFGLKELKPTNPLYRKLLSYRYYRLEDSSGTRSSRDTGRVKDLIRRMNVTMLKQKFSGEDPILVLDFLARFVQEADVLEMSEAQAYVALPYFLSGMAEDQYNSVRGSSRASEGGVTCWPEAVHYLLRSYATGTAISQAIVAVRDTKQKPGETETSYSTRLNKAFHRCGNVFTAFERCSMLVDGLDPGIRALVSRYREEKRKATYLELVQYAQAEGDTLRARDPRRRSSKALFVENEASSASLPNPGPPSGFADNIQYLGSLEQSLATSELPSTVTPPVVDPAFYANPGRVPPAPLAYASSATRHSRPGWSNPKQLAFQPQHPQHRGMMSHATGTRSAPLICYICYLEGHTASQCTLPIREMWKIVGNYENLPPEHKARVPSNSYEDAKAAVHNAQAREAAKTANGNNPNLSERAQPHPAVDSVPKN